MGYRAGYQDQTRRSIAIGSYAGFQNQGNTGGADCVAIGSYAGESFQDNNGVAISWKAGRYNQGKNCIAIGYSAGYQDQGVGVNTADSIAIGSNSAYFSQGPKSIAIGKEAAYAGQQSYSIAMGYAAANDNQQSYAVALGNLSGQISQNENAISIGNRSGQFLQGINSIALGNYAGNGNQQINCVAIGNFAGEVGQGTTEEATGGHCVAIGTQAGQINQGDFSVAIGAYAGVNSQADSSIILNASAVTLDATGPGLYVAPLNQKDTNEEYYTLHYHPQSKEVLYGLSNASTPGLVQMFAGVSAPHGFLLCDGSAVSRVTYKNLFNVIGVIYGAGDGVNTFNIPNLQGRVPVGRDATQTEFDVLGETGGEKTHTLTIAEMPAHTHTYLGVQSQGAASGFDNVAENSPRPTETSGSTGGSLPHNNLQPYIVLNYIISY